MNAQSLITRSITHSIGSFFKNQPDVRAICIVLAAVLFTAHYVHATDGTDTYDIRKALTPSHVITPVVVIGSGPAGLTAGMYAVRGGFPTKIYTGVTKGGQLTETSYVENYTGVKRILGNDLMSTMMEQAAEFGAELIEESIESVDFSQWPFVLRTDAGQEIRALSVIITTGATSRKLGIPGEDEHWGSGVSSCAICDGHFFKGKDVVVVGGGDAAVEEAMQLSPFAKTVTIFVRSGRMRAADHMQRKLQGYSNVKLQYNKQVTQIIGDGDSVSSLEVLDTVTARKSMIQADGLFLAIGHIPATELFSGQLSLTDDGYIQVQSGRPGLVTSVPGVFAAGDVMDPWYRQAIVSAGFGCIAALEATQWLREIGVTDNVIKQIAKNNGSTNGNGNGNAMLISR